MQLIYLKTKSFKKLDTFECEFGPGLNVISGENFTGKSTLLQAIEAALFGVTVVPGKAENIPTWGQSNFSLELGFIINGERYTLTRNKSTAKLQRLSPIDGDAIELVANGNTPVKAAIEELLGCSAKDFNLFIQSKQGESAGVLTFGATALNRKVEEHAGVDVIEKVQSLAQIRATRLLARSENRPTEERLLEVNEALRVATDAAECATGLHLALQRELDAYGEYQGPVVENTAPDMRKRAQDAAVLLTKLEAAEAAVLPAEKAVAEARERIGDRLSKDASVLEGQLANAYSAGIAAKKALDTLRTGQQDYTAAQREVDRCQQAFDQAGENVPQLSAVGVLALAEDDLEAAVKASDETRTALAATEAKVRSLTEMGKDAKCPTCNTQLKDHDPEQLARELSEAKAASATAQQVAVEASKKESAARAALKAIEDQDRKAQAALDALAALEKALENAKVALALLTKVDESQIHDAEATHQAARDDYARIQAELKGVQAENERLQRDYEALQRAKVAHDEAMQTALSLDTQYSELPEPPTEEEITAAEKAYHQYLSDYQTWKDQHVALSTKVSQALSDRDNRLNLVKIGQSTVDQLQEQVKAADDAAIEAKKCDRLVRFLRDGRQGYMKQVWDSILAVSSRLVREASAGAITKIENDDGEFLFEEDGVLAPTSSASGAQKSFIGSALRIGLGRTLYGSDSLLIFDEPTESCSERNASGMSAMLATSAKQVLLITHRENDQALAQHIINVGA